MLRWRAQSSVMVQDVTQPGGLGACNSPSTGTLSGGAPPPQSSSSCHGEWALTRPSTGIRGYGKAWQGLRPSGHSQGRGYGYISPLGVAEALSQAPLRPLLIVATRRGGVAWPLPAPQPNPEHTPYLSPGSWLMPRCSPGVLPSWGARHGRRRSGEAAEVLAWPAGPGRAPRPALGPGGPLGRAPRGAPRWERIGHPEPPTGEAEAVPR